MARDRRRRREGLKWWAWSALAGIVLAVLFLLHSLFPSAVIGPKQPISFSHRVHAGVKRISCRFCHPFVERSPHAGLPAMEKCFFCHTYVIPTHPEIQREWKHLQSGVPVRWVRVFFIPDHVKFRHEPHVAWAKLDCSVCHGRVDRMDRLQRVDFQMGFCIGCHNARGAQTDCWLACHH
ncbi:MAG: cytochrome c3 family protein [Deltaproteobacteria bacterium]|nr:cytochrome c3 family protein [Deltaproteobacteria bacterium]